MLWHKHEIGVRLYLVVRTTWILWSVPRGNIWFPLHNLNWKLSAYLTFSGSFSVKEIDIKRSFTSSSQSRYKMYKSDEGKGLILVINVTYYCNVSETGDCNETRWIVHCLCAMMRYDELKSIVLSL